MRRAVNVVLKEAAVIVDKIHCVRDCGRVVPAVRKRLKRAGAAGMEAR
jgi:hypothetical protein